MIFKNYIFIILSLIILFYILNNNDIDLFHKKFLKKMKKYLLWFYNEKYIDYKYLHYDSDILTFLYKNRYYKEKSPIIYKDLVIKIIKFFKILNENKYKNYEKNKVLIDLKIEILNLFQSFIFSINTNIDKFNTQNNYLNKLLSKYININNKELNNNIDIHQYY